MLTSDYIDGLRCFEFDDEFHGEPVKRLHLFRPEAVRNAGLMVRTASELEQHPEIILFEGYTDELGRVYVADRRMPTKAAVKGTSRTLLHILARLHFCTIARSRGSESEGSKPCSAGLADNRESDAKTSEVQNGSGRGMLYKKAEEHATPRTVPIKKLGSYGPGAGWPHSYENSELREWLNSWERKRDSE